LNAKASPGCFPFRREHVFDRTAAASNAKCQLTELTTFGPPVLVRGAPPSSITRVRNGSGRSASDRDADALP
jgi:hypothetical protein